MSDDFIFTSESVTRGHPDKLCDQVSDAIVDYFLRHDPHAGVVAECAVASGVLFISCHYASKAGLAIQDVARRVIAGIGYSRDVFDADACTIMTSFVDHSEDDYRELDLEAMTDDDIDAIAVTDQATVFGFACDQTEALMPLPIWLAHRLAMALDDPAIKQAIPGLLPDAKTQVGIEYIDGTPKRPYSIGLVTSQADYQHPRLDDLRQALLEQVVTPLLDEVQMRPDDASHIFINPHGPIIGGGPAAHSGLTGRKTGIDSYGEYARHSGAALSGKDPMRIDRVGAYAARWAAKNVVAAGLARECEVQLSYAIGIAGPVSLRVRTFGTGTIEEAEIARRLQHNFDFRIAAIVRDLALRQLPAVHRDGFYQRLACYGQMGRTDLDVTWERTDRMDALR